MDWLKESPCDVIDRAAFSTPEEEKEMFAKQKEILELAGIPRA